MAGGKLRAIRRIVQRKLVFDPGQVDRGNLKRCLNQWDLTALGVGSTLGVGIYVLVGSVALHIAGPSIVISFLIAAVASLFAGLCYAEFGSRVPRAGSAYVYTYVAVGELAAFIVGWNLILEGVFGTASVARGLSMYVDSMVQRNMSSWFTTIAPIHSVHLSQYFDFFAFLCVIVLGILLAAGVRASSMVNNVFAMLNMVVIAFIVFVGAFKADSNNWFIPTSEVPDGFGVGGFFPYGVWGTLRGAAICFYGFVGFDTISSTGEEVHSPRRTIPCAILCVLGIVLVAYTSVALVITMMVPYYLQENVASVATAFAFVGWNWARWMVGIGAIFGICASLFGAMFPLPRLLYAMASDGLLLHWFAKVSSSGKSPVLATLFPAAIIATLAAILELEQLVIMMCIGTLLSYTIVAICVILLRYKSHYSTLVTPTLLRQVFGCGDSAPTKATARVVLVALTLFVCSCLVTALVTVHAQNPLIPVVVLHVLALLLLAVMALQPQNKEQLSFKTPLVPVIPCLSIYVNIHLMILINVQTWIRVVIWCLIGIPIYIMCVCIYKRKSNLENKDKEIHPEINGKPPIQIVVEAPTPPDTMTRANGARNDDLDRKEELKLETKKDVKTMDEEESISATNEVYKVEEIVQYQIIESNEEKEAKIIDLLDQVLLAEEDTYSEIISFKEKEDDVLVSTESENIPHRPSFSELSDAGSDASLGNLGLSIYDVIAQVHREDLPKLTEEDDKSNNEANIDKNKQENENYYELNEDMTEFNESETTSRTDESGYSDTLDRNPLNESVDDVKEDAPYIPEPPPLDENYFKSPTFKKSYTMSAKPTRIKEEENKPRTSNLSNNSQDDGTIVFGSDRQMNFMSKLNNIFQNKISTDEERTDKEDEPRKRSQSTGNMTENINLSASRKRLPIFFDLKKEIVSREKAQNLKRVYPEETEDAIDDDEDDDSSMTREDLKSKLESIFALNGPNLLKPRLMRSNPPTPEDSYPTDNSSVESIPKTTKIDKNDTLGKQKAKFGEVLSSLRISMNRDDNV